MVKVDIEKKNCREQPVYLFNTEMLALFHYFNDVKIWGPFVTFKYETETVETAHQAFIFGVRLCVRVQATKQGPV